jgi:hypothetical protein
MAAVPTIHHSGWPVSSWTMSEFGLRRFGIYRRVGEQGWIERSRVGHGILPGC